MDYSQLYDAFENILEIEMPEDEFQILFKKVCCQHVTLYHFS